MLSPNMQRLEELESKFQSDPDHLNPPTTEWEVGEGKVVRAWTLLNRRNVVTVVKSFGPAGSVFPAHKHKEVEVLTIYEGRARYSDSSGVDTVMEPGDSIRILPGVSHEFQTIEDTWLIGVTIPDSEAFAK